jgi:hypothetical protein
MRISKVPFLDAILTFLTGVFIKVLILVHIIAIVIILSVDLAVIFRILIMMLRRLL